MLGGVVLTYKSKDESMNQTIKLIGIVIWLLAILPSHEVNAQKVRKVLFVIVDGIPLTGAISAMALSLERKNDRLEVGWKALGKSGLVKIWLAMSNDFACGASDKYVLVGTVSLLSQKATINLSRFRSGSYKVVIETATNFLNRWAPM
jgi:hypothetical protein